VSAEEAATTTPRSRRGRPRTPGAEDRLFSAALEEYGEHGWAGFTMDAVARRAGVGKSTIYLRWRDKDDLLSDAVAERRPNEEIADTGSLRSDLELLAENFFHFYLDAAGWATLRIVIDAAGSPEPLGRFADAVTDLHREAMKIVGERAVARGDAPATDELDQLWSCLYGSLLIQVLELRTRHRGLDEEQIADRARVLADFVLTRVRA
jgi:AcrR family transcriptional regulator